MTALRTQNQLPNRLAHAALWLAFFAWPRLYDSSKPLLGWVFSPAFLLFAAVFMAVFYLHTRLLLPRLLERKKTAAYVASFLAALAVVLTVRPFHHLAFSHRDGPPGHLPGGPGAHGGAFAPPAPPEVDGFLMDISSFWALVVVWVAGLLAWLFQKYQEGSRPVAESLSAAPAAVEARPESTASPEPLVEKNTAPAPRTAAKPDAAEAIFVHVEYELVRIPTADIQHVEGYDDYIKIHLDTGRPVVTRLSLREVLEKLPDGRFARIHRSYIVSKEKVAAFTSSKVRMAGGAELPVGRSFRGALG